MQWVSGALFLGIKRPGREADHSLPYSTEIKECVELYLHSPILLHGVVLIKKSKGATLPFTFKHSRIVDKGLSIRQGAGQGIKDRHRDKPACHEMLRMASGLVAFCEHGNEPPVSIKGGELLD
jgi:hypothetical protein